MLSAFGLRALLLQLQILPEACSRRLHVHSACLWLRADQTSGNRGWFSGRLFTESNVEASNQRVGDIQSPNRDRTHCFDTSGGNRPKTVVATPFEAVAVPPAVAIAMGHLFTSRAIVPTATIWSS